MKNIFTPLAKSILTVLTAALTLVLTAAAAAADAAIQKNYELGTTALIISNEEMDYIMEIVKSRRESGLLNKGVSETIGDESKEQKDRFLDILLGTLAASLLGNLKHNLQT